MKNKTPDNEYIRAIPYASVATVAAVHTMLLQELLPTATTQVITSMTSKLREYSYELESHADKCIFGHGTLIVYGFNRPDKVSGCDPSLRSSE